MDGLAQHHGIHFSLHFFQLASQFLLVGSPDGDLLDFLLVVEEVQLCEIGNSHLALDKIAILEYFLDC